MPGLTRGCSRWPCSACGWPTPSVPTGRRHPGPAVPSRADLGLGADDWADLDWGPYEPWVRPLLLLADGDRDAAEAALRALPEGPHDLLREVRLCLVGRAAHALGDRATMARVHAELLPAADELAAGSGVLTVGPVAGHLADLAAALGRRRGGGRHRRTARAVTARARATA